MKDDQDIIQALEDLQNSVAWQIIYKKALSHKDSLYQKAINTESCILAKNYLEQIKGIDFILNLPKIEKIKIQKNKENNDGND